MVSNTRTNRFQTFSPLRTVTSGTHTLSRLRTAFSPTRSMRSTSPASSTGTTSPLTRTSSPDYHHPHRDMHSLSSSPSSTLSGRSRSTSIRELLRLRRKPSTLELEMEEERRCFGYELEMLEPRPQVGLVGGCGAQQFGTFASAAATGRTEMVGIFEVLEGRV